LIGRNASLALGVSLLTGRRRSRLSLFAEDAPIVRVNANAANPHYEPSAKITSEIRSGDLVLLDMWANLDRPGAVYRDITWTGFCGDRPRDEMLKVYERRGATSPAAAMATISFIAPATRSAKKCTATAPIWTTWKRTTSAAWCDGRVFPGVYLKDFGIRSEVNMFVGETDARVTGEMQTELIIL
jgi:Xaa-Pro dipeptidase